MSYGDPEYTYHRDPQGTVYRVSILPDPDAESPRQNGDANLATLVTWDSRWMSPDRTTDRQGYTLHVPDDIEAESIFDRMPDHAARALHLYTKLYRPDILAAVPLVRNDYDGTISTDDTGSGHLIGVAYVTRSDWDKCMTAATPLDGSTGSPTPLEAIDNEVNVYNAWCTGEFARYEVERATSYTRTFADGRTDAGVEWDITEDGSCGGFESEEYAKEEALDTLPAGTVEIPASDLDDQYTA